MYEGRVGTLAHSTEPDKKKTGPELALTLQVIALNIELRTAFNQTIR